MSGPVVADRTLPHWTPHGDPGDTRIADADRSNALTGTTARTGRILVGSAVGDQVQDMNTFSICVVEVAEEDSQETRCRSCVKPVASWISVSPSNRWSSLITDKLLGDQARGCVEPQTEETQESSYIYIAPVVDIRFPIDWMLVTLRALECITLKHLQRWNR